MLNKLERILSSKCCARGRKIKSIFFYIHSLLCISSNARINNKIFILRDKSHEYSNLMIHNLYPIESKMIEQIKKQMIESVFKILTQYIWTSYVRWVIEKIYTWWRTNSYCSNFRCWITISPVHYLRKSVFSYLKNFS